MEKDLEIVDYLIIRNNKSERSVLIKLPIAYKRSLNHCSTTILDFNSQYYFYNISNKKYYNYLKKTYKETIFYNCRIKTIFNDFYDAKFWLVNNPKETILGLELSKNIKHKTCSLNKLDPIRKFKILDFK